MTLQDSVVEPPVEIAGGVAEKDEIVGGGGRTTSVLSAKATRLASIAPRGFMVPVDE